MPPCFPQQQGAQRRWAGTVFSGDVIQASLQAVRMRADDLESQDGKSTRWFQAHQRWLLLSVYLYPTQPSWPIQEGGSQQHLTEVMRKETPICCAPEPSTHHSSPLPSSPPPPPRSSSSSRHHHHHDIIKMKCRPHGIVPSSCKWTCIETKQ